MNNGVHLIMPMAGGGTRFSKNGFDTPKPLIEINGKPFFFWATQSIRKFVNLESLTFVILKSHIENFAIDEKIVSYFPEAKFVVLNDVLNGAVLTCLEGIKNINDDLPIIFNDCDHLFYCEQLYNYINESNFDDIDGVLLTFLSDDPKFSYIEINSRNDVVRTVEKVVISNDAICGAYYFKNRRIFEEMSKEYISNCSYEEFFVSGVYNSMAKNGMCIRNFRVNKHLPFGTPDEYRLAKNSKDFKMLI